MEFAHISALALFAFVTTFTPGPNNIMLMTSGANVGFARSIPHLLGVTFGFSAMLMIVGAGLTGAFNSYPFLHTVLKVISLIYLLYLAVKIATSKPTQNTDGYRPMNFFSAAMFQWMNPKGWTMALTAVSVYNPSSSWLNLLIIATVFIFANLPSTSIWVVAGQHLQTWLTTPKRVKSFNYIMALLLIGSTFPMLH